MLVTLHCACSYWGKGSRSEQGLNLRWIPSGASGLESWSWCTGSLRHIQEQDPHPNQNLGWAEASAALSLLSY